jgi:transposase InsO family protein
MNLIEQLANERIRSNLELAGQLRHSRRQRTLRRARRIEHRAERHMIKAWPRAAELRTKIESLTY